MGDAFRYTTGKLIDFYSGDWVETYHSVFKFILVSILLSLALGYALVFIVQDYLNFEWTSPDYKELIYNPEFLLSVARIFSFSTVIFAIPFIRNVESADLFRKISYKEIRTEDWRKLLIPFIIFMAFLSLEISSTEFYPDSGILADIAAFSPRPLFKQWLYDLLNFALGFIPFSLALLVIARVQGYGPGHLFSRKVLLFACLTMILSFTLFDALINFTRQMVSLLQHLFSAVIRDSLPYTVTFGFLILCLYAFLLPGLLILLSTPYFYIKQTADRAEKAASKVPEELFKPDGPTGV